MAGTPVAPALPTMEAAFAGHASSELLVRLMLTMPGLFIALLAPASGWLVDRFGRKPLLVWGTLLYATAGSSGLYLDSLWAILIGRACLGVAVAGIMTAAVTLIGDFFKGPERHRFMGWQSAFMSFGGMVFLLAGGMLSDMSWRGPFAIYLTALIILPMVITTISEPDPLDDADVVDRTVGPVVMGGIAPQICLIYAIAFFGMVAFYAIPVQIPFHLRALTGADGTYVGIAIACMTLFATLSSMAYSHVKARTNFQGVLAVMLLGIGIGYLLVAHATSYTAVLMGMTVAGLGLGLLMPNLNVWLMQLAPEASRGRLVGGLTTSLFLGQFVSPIVLRPIVAGWGTTGVFNVLGAAQLVATLVFASFAIRRPRLATEASTSRS